MEETTGAFGATAACAVCATGAGCGVAGTDNRAEAFSGPTQLAISHWVSGDHASFEAFVAIMCLAASPQDSQAKVAAIPIQMPRR